MQATVNTLCALSGVTHAGIYKDGEVISANFSSTQLAAMNKSGDIIAQIFFALQSIDKSHNELYFGISTGYLAAFRLHNGYIALLLTDKKINFPMLSMAIKSASETIKQRVDAEQAESERQQTLADAALPLEPAPPIEETLLPIFEQYTQLLTGYLGPAASVVVDDAVASWKQTYLQTPNNLSYLLTMLEEELDSEKERQEFSVKAAGVFIPDM